MVVVYDQKGYVVSNSGTSDNTEDLENHVDHDVYLRTVDDRV